MNERPVINWGGHYQHEGERKIAARQQLYLCAAERLQGLPLVDLELEAINALAAAGLPERPTVVDVGCSYPNFLKLWQLEWQLQGRPLQAYGRLVGVEPSTAQFKGAPYLPRQEAPARSGGSTRTLFRLIMQHSPELLEGIELFEGTANELPLDDGVADAVTSMFMFYHVPAGQQTAALREMKRLLKPDSGLFALATRGQRNKRVMRENEARIATELGRFTGRLVLPPPPVNSGFTSEDARRVLPDHFAHVYEFEHRSRFVFTTAKEAFYLDEAYWSLQDMYRDQTGQPPDGYAFAVAFDRVMGAALRMVRDGQGAIEDELQQSLFIAADRPLALPAKYRPF